MTDKEKLAKLDEQQKRIAQKRAELKKKMMQEEKKAKADFIAKRNQTVYDAMCQWFASSGITDEQIVTMGADALRNRIFSNT